MKSPQGTQFRIWATKRIQEYIVKGFTMDDERLKQEGASEVNINLNEGLVNFSADNSKLELIKKAIDDKGYEVVN